MMADLTKHFDSHEYLLGGKPSIADFSFGGMMYAHLFKDPIPGYIMKTTAPSLAVWCEMIMGNRPDANRSFQYLVKNGEIVKEIYKPQAFCDNDVIPITLNPIFKRMLSEFGPVLLETKNHVMSYAKKNALSNNTKLPRILGSLRYKIGSVEEDRKVLPFNIWMWQQVTDYYQSLTPSKQQDVCDWVKQYPYGLDIVTADLSPCRVERIDNILHLAKSAVKFNSKL